MYPLLIVSVLLLLAIMLFLKRLSSNRMPGKKKRAQAVAELKAYLGRKENELLYVRTAEHEYVYWTEEGKTQLEIDGQPVGLLEGGALFGKKTGKELARIAATARENYLPVSVGNREVGALQLKPLGKDDPLSQRAFQFIPEDLNDKEEQLLMSLATRELVKRSIPAE